jgi:CHASE2 domain-containing sensor protein
MNFASNSRRRSLGPYLTRSALPVLIGVSLLTWWLDETGWLRGSEGKARDVLMALSSPKEMQNVEIVAVTDEDLGAFGGHFPLAPLSVKRLLNAVAAGNPKVIAVDLDTSLWKPDDLKGLPSSPTIVWARAVRHPSESDSTMEPMAVLGGARNLTDHSTGLAIMPQDSDGVYRRHQRVYEVESNGSRVLVPSFAWAVVSAARKLDPIQTAPKDDLLMNFSGNIYDLNAISAGTVLDAAHGEGWAEGILKDKIVMVGGTYWYSHDQHATPAGPLYGVQIMAQAVETELSGGGIGAANQVKMFLLEILVGLGLAVLHYYRPKAVPFGVVGVLLLAPICSYLAFSSFAMWVNFVPILIAVILHQGYDLAHDNHMLQGENAYLKQQVHIRALNKPMGESGIMQPESS